MLRKTPLKRTPLKRTPIKRKPFQLSDQKQLKTKPLKRTSFKRKTKTAEELVEEKRLADKNNAFWDTCWEKLPRRSEVSGTTFHEVNRTHYHHLWKKAKYPEIRYAISGILCVTLDEHTQVENNTDLYDVALKRWEWVRDNWDLCLEEHRLWEENYERKLKDKNQ